MKSNLVNAALAIAVMSSTTIGQQKSTKINTKLRTQTSESDCKTKVKPEILQKVKLIIADELGLEATKIALNARFVEDLGADSLDFVEMIMRFEEEFKIEIPDEDAEKVNRVCDVFTILRKHMKKNK